LLTHKLNDGRPAAGEGALYHSGFF